MKIKHREFEIKEQLDEQRYICTYKGREYLVIQFVPKSDEGNKLTYSLKRISITPINAPKLRWIDKKAGYIVRDYIPALIMTDYLSKQDMTEELYDQLFKNAYYAKMSGMTISYSPNDWGLYNGSLFYLGETFSVFKKEEDLVDKSLRLWFNTRELSEFMKNNGVFYDKNRIKGEYEVNKEIVLMACKYYR